jgi:hypothetical protein
MDRVTAAKPSSRVGEIRVRPRDISGSAAILARHEADPAADAHRQIV